MRYIFFFILTAGWQHYCRAQSNATPVSYNNPGTVYTQNFDGLPNSGSFSLVGKGPFTVNASPINGTNLGGWQLLMIAGTNTNASFSVGTGSSTGNGVYSFGSSGSGERALGTLASSTGIYAIGFILTNNTGGLLNSFTVSFTGEQWRKGGSTNKNSWNFRYKTGSFLQIDQPGLTDESHLNFSSVINTSAASSLNGNLPENQQNISYTINSITWKPGEQLLLRWDDADETGNDDACGIDNFSFSASLTSSTPTVLTKAATNISSTTALLTGTVNDNFANTSVVFEYDSLNTLENSKTVHAVPDTIFAASGNTNVSATLSGLLPGVNYYYRVKATNNKGSTVGSMLQFITPISLPVVLTGNIFSVTTHSAYLGGNVTGTGGSTVIEKGIVWALTQSPVLTDNKIAMGSGAGSFAETISGLPDGSKIYARAFATNAGGTAYGDSIVFTTQTTIISLSTLSANKTNSQTVTFLLQTGKAIDGLTASNFILQTVGVSGAFISGIGVSGNMDTITVNTGTGDGLIGLRFNNNTGLSATIENTPFTATGSYTIDKTPPIIKSVLIPDQSMKIGDTIPVILSVFTDTDIYKIISGKINGSNLFGLLKTNDSIYTCSFTIQNRGNDIMSEADISVSLLMADSVGNNSISYQSPIHQPSDRIDANAPFILSGKNPPDNIYKLGDELDFIFYFNEKVQVISNGNTASLPITIGTKAKQAVFVVNDESDSLIFRYIIQSGDLDKDGIKKGNAIQLNNAEINDLAGNIAMLSFSSTSTKNITVDAVIPAVSNTTVPVAASYRTGNILDFIVNYSKKVIVASTDSFPVLQVNIGTKIKNAAYISGSGSTALLFRYTIQQDDFDKDGIKLTSSVFLNNSTIKDEVGNHALLVLNNIGSMSGIKINPVTAAINKVMVPMNGIYKSGDTLDFIAGYNENVRVDTGKGIPVIKFVVGSSTKQAVYKNGSGSNELLFSYIIQPGDEDTNGIKINSAITLNNGVIMDPLSNPVPVSLNNIDVTDGILVDAIAPTIKSVSIPANKLYKLNDTLDFVYHFSEKVTVETASDKPDILLTIGSTVKNLSYVSGSGTDNLLFRYVVLEGDFTKDGIKTGTSIQLNSTKIKDGAGNIAATLFSTPSTKGILIDGVSPAINSVTAPTAGYYRTGDILDFMVNYTEKMIVISSDSLPGLQLRIGTRERNAAYVSGSGTGALLFRYIISPDDTAKEEIQLPPSLINLNNSGITDVAGNHTLGTLTNAIVIPDIRINAVTAIVNKVSIPEKGIYKTGDTLAFIISYSENVLVDTGKGTPSLKIMVGTASRQALYKYGSGGNKLLFTYIIQPGEEDTNGITISNTLLLNNGSVTDALHNPAPTLLNNMPDPDGIMVDAVSPVIKSITAPVNKFYQTNDTLDFVFHCSEIIKIGMQNDSPFIQLTIGSLIKKGVYVEGSGTDHLLFRYIIEQDNLDKNGIRLGSSIQLNNSSILDVAGNPLLTTIKNAGIIPGIKIDGIAPSFVKMKMEKLSVCENSSSLSINPALAISDEETGESIVWNIISGGSHGYLSALSFSGNATGKTINPNGFTYYPFRNHRGTDSLLAQVSDGINITEKMIIIEIQPAIINNFIAALQVICINNTPEIFSGSIPTGGDGQYKYTWESASADSIQFSKAAGTNDSPQYSPGQLKNDTWFRRRVNSGMCTDTSSTIKITVVKNGLWLGRTNNDWDNPNNWCNQLVPNNTTDVMLNSNFLYDPFIKDSAWCHDLLLADNTHLTITGILQLSGNIEGSGKSIEADKGGFIFEGKSQQLISGNLFKDHLVQNIVIRNDSGVALLDTLQLSGTLVLNKGSLITNDFLTLQPTATIGSSAAGTTINGNVFIEHLIKGGRRCFWLLGHPFVDDIGLQKIKDSIDITGGGGSINGFTNSATNEPSAFRNEPFLGNDSTGIDAGWIPFTQTNGIAENAWKSNSGIRLLMRGRPGQGLDGTPAGNGKRGTYLPEPVIIKVSGKVHTGDQEISAIKDKYAGYNVIANPYPSNIDLSLITHSSNVGPNYWVWNPWQAIKGGYTSIPFKNKNILPPFGAFIVRANENTNNGLLFTENCKTTGSVTDSLPVISIDDTYLLELRLETDSIFWDRVILLSVDSAKTGFDKNDAEKFENSDVNFFSISKDQKRLSIDARPFTNESTIPLGIETNEAGIFSIRVAKANLPAANKLMLHDRYLEKWMPLEKDSSYLFSTNADSMSKGNKRFEITGQKIQADTLPALLEMETTVTPVPAKDLVILRFASPEPGNTSIRLLTLSGFTVKTISLGMQKKGQVTIPVGGLLEGMYLIELRCGNRLSTQKIIKN